MAGKEGIFVILDVGKSMESKYNNTELTRLDFAKESARQLVRQKLLFNSKKDEIGIILKGTVQDDDEIKEHIKILLDLENPDINLLKQIDEIQTSAGKESKGDLFDSIEVAIDALIEKYKKLKWNKKIYIITDGEAKPTSTDKKIQNIAERLDELDIKVNIIVIDFFNELDEDNENSENEDVEMTKETANQEKTKEQLKELSNKTSNVKIFTSKMADYIYHQFKKKKINPITKYRGPLIITPNLKLDVMVYTKTITASLPPLKKYSLTAEYSNEPGKNQITTEKIYYIHDDPDQKPIAPEFIGKGYYYGSTLTPVSKVDEDKLKGKEEKCLKVIGFTDAFRVPRHYYMGGVDLVVPNPSEENDIRALKALVREMKKMNKVIIARYVPRANADPKLVVLLPHESKKGPVFYLNTLPTIEDLRDFQFNSLEPCTRGQEEFISGFIDSLNLDNASDGEEELKPNETYNPILQYFYQCLESRILNSEEELPPLDEEIEKYLIPSRKLFEGNPKVSFINKIFPIKEKEGLNDKKKRVFWKDILSNEMEEALSQKRIEEKLNAKKKESKKTISLVTPIKDFKEMIDNKDEDLVTMAMDQIILIINKYICESFGGSYYVRAVECIKAFRDAANDEDEVEKFNGFLNDLKTKFPKEVFDSFWHLFADNNITPISIEENSKSNMSQKECDDWLEAIRKKEIITSTIPDKENLLEDIE